MIRSVIVACGLAVLALGSTATVVAQTSASPLSADVFAGGAPRPDAEDADASQLSRPGGWQIGASFSKGLRRKWLQWTGAYGSHANDAVRVREVLGGVRVTSPWLSGNDTALRTFAHVLAGPSWSSGADGGAAAQVVIGGGFDVFVLRLQGDFVQTRHAGVPRRSGRAFVGAVVPLCLDDCRPELLDGFPIGRRHRD